MADDENTENEEKSTLEEQNQLIREKCHACAKGCFCMIDRDQRIVCSGPQK